MAQQYSVVLITAPDQGAADKLAQGLLQARLAACVNLVPGVRSSYWWEGKIERSEEVLLLVKTRSDLLPEITDFTRKNHPYSVPEVVSLSIQQGNQAYLDWIGASTQFTKPKSAPDSSRGR